jgi:hypothetical protein
MMINGPPVVASEGRTALKISMSALALVSSSQNAASLAMTATHVTPRSRRNEAARTSITIPLDSSIASVVRLTTSDDKIGEASNTPSM